MAKKTEVQAKKVCPCWSGHWKEIKQDGVSLNPPKFEWSCDYCGRVMESRGSGPFDHEKPGVPVGRHWEKEGEPK